jgi:hypothetical protein
LVNGVPCDDARGGTLRDNSSTWYGSSLDAEYPAFSDFGFKNITKVFGGNSLALGTQNTTTQSSSSKSISKLLHIEISSWTFSWMGILGLDIDPYRIWTVDARGNRTRLAEVPEDTLLTQLKRDKVIPSRSWAYTAGSRWRKQTDTHGQKYENLTYCPDGSNGAQGSLVLGGYDERRMIRNDVVFPFGKDRLRLHVVWVERITLAGNSLGRGNATFDLSRTNYKCLVDSTRPFIYLPPQVYDDIVQTLGLQYDNRTERLIIPDGAMKTLQQRQPSLSFQIAPLDRDQKPANRSAVTITLPFESLILRTDYTMATKNQSFRYVPLQKTTNSSLYVLGRAFLQNAYFVSDYERNSFSIHQAVLRNGTGLPPLLRQIRDTNATVNTLDSWKGEGDEKQEEVEEESENYRSNPVRKPGKTAAVKPWVTDGGKPTFSPPAGVSGS